MIGILFYTEHHPSAFTHTHTSYGLSGRSNEVAESAWCMATAYMKPKAASEQELCQLLKSTVLGTNPTFERKWDTLLCHKRSTKNYSSDTKLVSRKFEGKNILLPQHLSNPTLKAKVSLDYFLQAFPSTNRREKQNHHLQEQLLYCVPLRADCIWNSIPFAEPELWKGSGAIYCWNR